MKNIKYLFMMFAMVSIMLASCTKEDKIIDNQDPVEEVDTSNLTDNPLVAQIEGRDGEDGCELGCFTINYPFSLLVDGVPTEIDSEEDLESVLEGITEESVVDFVYPFEITFEDGETETINNEEDLGLAFSQCIPDEGWDDYVDTLDYNVFPAFLFNSDDYCYDLVYPVTLIDENQNETVVANEEEFIAALTNSESFYFFSFPLNLIGENGEVTVGEGEELFDLLIDCEYEGGGVDTSFNIGGTFGCYELVYPFSLILTNGEEVVINNHEEFCNVLLEGNVVGFSFPLTLINEDGEEIVVNSEEELEEAFEDCDNIIVEGDGTLFLLLIADNDANSQEGCYSINYPISVDTGDAIISLSSYEEVTNTMGDIGLGNLIFPVDITLNETGETMELNTIEDLVNVLTNCQ